MGKSCDFCKDGICYALVCYDGQVCGAKDNDGHPRYADTEECKPAQEDIQKTLEQIRQNDL